MYKVEEQFSRGHILFLKNWGCIFFTCLVIGLQGRRTVATGCSFVVFLAGKAWHLMVGWTRHLLGVNGSPAVYGVL